MARSSTHWLAVGFIAVGLAAAVLFGLMATGRLPVAGEWPGLLAGAAIVVLLLLALRR